MYCGPYSAGVYTLFLTRFRTYKIASPPQTKMTSEDDIKGLVSLKFLRPWTVHIYSVIFRCNFFQLISCGFILRGFQKVDLTAKQRCSFRFIVYERKN
jgi:hypothetical protein